MDSGSYNETPPLWSDEQDEQVEVNQRALIDKVLARYSGELAVFRELLQNADDAHAHRAEIQFQTKAVIDCPASGLRTENLPNLETELLHKWIFRNDGKPFEEQDWSRLKKIAEGNPDSDKIGAFGVGFYSLFSVTEEPSVKSGTQSMAFYWRDGKDQLFVSRRRLQHLNSLQSGIDPWTTFEMVLRDPGPLPCPPMELARFITTSLTFMIHLREVSVFFDDTRLIRISKEVDEPQGPAMLHRPLPHCSPEQLTSMVVQSIGFTELRMKAEILQWVYTTCAINPRDPSMPPSVHQINRGFLSRLWPRAPQYTLPEARIHAVTAAPFDIVESTAALGVYAALIDINLDEKLLNELERATKKKPPTRSIYRLIYTSKNNYDVGRAEEQEIAAQVFSGLRADLDGLQSARIFIGHATAEATGVGGHMAAHLIPTVERERIDLENPYVKQWNEELLFVGGYLCWTVWQSEMAALNINWTKNTDAASRKELVEQCLHVMRFFFVPGAPLTSRVACHIQRAFFTCAKEGSISLLSTVGVLTSDKIRIPSSEPTGFLKRLPVLPSELVVGARALVAALQEHDLIREISMVDVIEELKCRALSENEMSECLKWRIARNADPAASCSDFLEAATFFVGDNHKERTVSLLSVQSFLNPRALAAIPTDVPLPRHALPYNISKSLPLDKLSAVFGWTELALSDWLCFVLSEHFDSETESVGFHAFAERVMSTAARGWLNMPAESRLTVVKVLKSKACIPTSHGMRRPTEAYFSTAHVFHDLPIIQFAKGIQPTKGTMEKMLVTLGVRKRVELGILFDRMTSTEDWSTFKLVRYLVDVKDTLSSEEWIKLRQTPGFAAEGSGTLDKDVGMRRKLAKDLCEPNDKLRQMGVPVLAWFGAKWNAKSEEAKLLRELGLQRHPSVAVILELAARDHPTSRLALDYFLENYSSYYANRYEPKEVLSAFVPAVQSSNMKTKGMPTEVFLNADCSVLGFSLLDPSLKSQAHNFKLKENPPIALVVEKLICSPPSDRMMAISAFEYMTKRCKELRIEDWERLRNAAIVPYPQEGSGTTPVFVMAADCYFGKDGELDLQYHSKLFRFIDFGDLANVFLLKCGAKSEVGVKDIAAMFISSPGVLYKISGHKRYLEELRSLAMKRQLLSTSLQDDLKNSPFLLCMRRDSSRFFLYPSDETDNGALHDLRKATEIVIIDDESAYADFSASIYAAPQERLLEDLYEELGAKRLSRLISREYKYDNVIDHLPLAVETRRLILERLPIFLHQRNPANGHGNLLVTPAWLTDEDNFKVVAVGRLSLTRSLLSNSAPVRRETKASAGAGRDGSSGALYIWVSVGDGLQLDVFEVADAICGQIFEQHTVNDSFFFSGLLSADLNALRRRGFAVDRIFQEQQRNRQARERERLLTAKTNASPQRAALGTLWHAIKDGAFLKTFRGLASVEDKDANPGIASLKAIQKTLDVAIAACRPENKHLRNHGLMTGAEETSDEGYCDAGGEVQDLLHIDDVNGHSIWARNMEDSEHAQTILSDKHCTLSRFISEIVEPIAKLFEVPQTSMHIFYDSEGRLIAFNRDGILFLNLWFYEAMHDKDVRDGNLAKALISWYFIVAHEIIHNLVPRHNSRHEFLFSSLCENYLERFMTQLGKSG